MAWPARRRCWCLRYRRPTSPAIGLGYVALFGIGSMIGMGALSSVIAVPLAVSARWLTSANRGLQGAVGVVTIAIGVMTIVETAFCVATTLRVAALTFGYRGFRHLSDGKSLRVRLTGILEGGLNPCYRAFG